jgi:hypothetical protein
VVACPRDDAVRQRSNSQRSWLPRRAELSTPPGLQGGGLTGSSWMI